MRRLGLFVLSFASLAGASAYLTLRLVEGIPLPTGKYISPLSNGVAVGSFPVQMRISPDGKWLVVTNSGFRQQLTVIDTTNGQIVSKLQSNGAGSGGRQGLYWGLDFAGSDLYVSRGAESQVSVFRISDAGQLEPQREITMPGKDGQKRDNFLAGVAVQGTFLYAANNQASSKSGWRSEIGVFNLDTGMLDRRIPSAGFPLGIVATSDGVFWTSEQDGVVTALTPTGSTTEIKLGASPTAISAGAGMVYVSNSGSDTVSVIDPKRMKVVKTISLRPSQLSRIPSCTPLGLSVSPDGETLYVALADMNAVAVVDLNRGAVASYIPVGWYPTDVQITHDGKRLFVSNAKGVVVRQANSTAPRGDRRGINLLEGTVMSIEIAYARSNANVLTETVMRNNRLGSESAGLLNPGISHVIYIIKENRTYDNVFGDLPGGDPSLCLFPREVTPNQHALAERFVLLDNFYCAAEVSGDGWQWSTASAANEYVSRNVAVNYSGRGKDYDFEGAINGGRPEFDGKNDVGSPPGGFLWDNALRHRVSLRDYGFFVGEPAEFGAKPGVDTDKAMIPTKKALLRQVDPDFREYDLAYPDSDLNKTHGVEVPGEMKSYGANGATSRFQEWKGHFDEYVRNGWMPKLQLVRFCRNHTAGTAKGQLTPRAMVADNDYAVGQLVEAISKSRFWKDTMICILEDDAQGGIDHVDTHRSPALVISPYVVKGTRDSRFYNTCGMLRTIELLLGLPPMNGYDAVADPLAVFGRKAANIDPFTAILIDKSIAGQINGANAYRSADSEKMSRFGEDSAVDLDLNDILWRSIKKRPLPARGRLER